jgi:hypothetical protein
MHTYRYNNDDYLLTIYYEGKKLTYRLKRHSHDRDHDWFHLFTRAQTKDLCWSRKTKTLSEELIPGQEPMPQAFLKLLEAEIRQIAG